MNKKDYYKILGVEKTSTEEDIKKAFRKLAHQYHPDKSGGDEKRFKEINEAYQVLSSKDKRAQYDKFGTAFDGQGGGFDFRNFGGEGFEFGFDPSQFGEMGDFGDVFDSIFEGLGIKKKRKTYHRGSDVELIQEITLEEAFSGVEKKTSFKTFVVCAECAGLGHHAKSGFDNCSACDGRGEVRENRSTFFGNFTQVRPCGKCGGEGKIPNKICGQCSGHGRVAANKQMNVNIAAGLADGQIMKISKVGEVGEKGADSGDVYVHIRVRPHPVFRREGENLFVKKEVSALDLLLGKKIEVQTIDKKTIKVEIPAGFNLSQRLEVAGAGMPRFGAYGRGSLFVEFIVKIPHNLSAKAKKLLEELEGEMEK